MKPNFKFNGIRKPYCSYLDYEAQYGLERELEINSVKGRPGGVLNGISIKPREIEVTFLFDSFEVENMDINKIADDAVNWLTTDEPVEMIFDREPDKIYYAMLQGKLDVEGIIAYSKVTATFICLDPYKYSTNTYTNTAISDQLAIVNKGNAPTPPLITARAIKAASSYMITKGDEDYFMVGDDDVDKTIKDYTPELFNSELRTLSGWTKQGAGVINDNYTGGTTGGSFSQSSTKESVYLNLDTITAQTGWNGAEYRKSFGRSAQDFSTTAKIALYQKNKGSTHFAQYVYDTDNRLLASIGYVNSSSSQNTGRIIVTIFDQTGNQKKIYDYKNNPKFYNWDDIIVYMRLKRVGNTFYIKTWKYKEVEYPKRIVPVDIHETVWVDKGDFYQRPIASLGLYSAKNGLNKHMRTYILGTYTHEILPKPPAAKDKFIKQGDLLQIDMKNKTVTLNDEPILSEKTFGSDWFELDSGLTEMFVMPEGIFDTTAEWKDRFQ